MVVHPQAAVYTDVADSYERGRPGYPRALLDWIGSRGHLGPGATVVDLGAGTGKLTRLLVESGATVVAVEPLEAMRAQLAEVLPDVELLDAPAEAIPLEDSSADVVACGMSFHWFVNEGAIGEISRVLRPGGELVLVTNGYDRTNPLERRLGEIRREAEAEAEEVTPGGNWREVITSDPRFELIGEVALENTQVVDRAGVIHRVYSSSPFARLSPARQQELLATLEPYLTDDVATFNLRTNAMALRNMKPA